MVRHRDSQQTVSQDQEQESAHLSQRNTEGPEAYRDTTCTKAYPDEASPLLLRSGVDPLSSFAFDRRDSPVLMRPLFRDAETTPLGPLEGCRKRSSATITELESRTQWPPWSPVEDEPLHTQPSVPYGYPSQPPSSTFSFSKALAPPLLQPQPNSVASPAPPAPPAVHMSRYGLRIRQQPVSARAGPPGRDRRTIDPPCILQLTITDFDPNSQEDMDDLTTTTTWVVKCALRPAERPARAEGDSDNQIDLVAETGKLLLGESAVNAFFSPADPDPKGAAAHPSTKMWSEPSGSHTRGKAKEEAMPASFFIFSDLSVRRAGRYRLEFRLIKMDAIALMNSQGIPVQAQITSDVFECYNAKDFPSIQPSTELVRGLLKQGAPRPLTLKKGIQGRKSRGLTDDEDE
ncbi:MAG: hypothetical protein Q9227_003170 [Pyrenula ochraceoflavens]